MEFKLNVSFVFDLDRLNHALGNTPNVKAKEALNELLNAMLFEYDRYDNYGCPNKHWPELQNHVCFEIIEPNQKG